MNFALCLALTFLVDKLRRLGCLLPSGLSVFTNYCMKLNMHCVLFLLLIIGLSSAKNYFGYQVYRINVTNDEERNLLRTFDANREVNVWRDFVSFDAPVDIMVAPSFQKNFTMSLLKQNMHYSVLIPDVGGITRPIQQAAIVSYRQKWTINFSDYYRHEQINDYMHNLGKTYSHIAKVLNIGKSYDERDMDVLYVSTGGNGTKPAIFIDGGIHGREWIAPAQVLYIIHQLVELNINETLINKLDWYFLPVANPDGYEFSHIEDRYWRKTRSGSNHTMTTDFCIGVDPNRNFDFHWNKPEKASESCKENYPGKEPFSEIETQHIRDFGNRIKNQLKLYLSFHSYGKYIMHSWGHTDNEQPDNYIELEKLGNDVRKALKVGYKVGSTSKLMYFASGQSQDWFKGVANVPLSYTIELPGGGEGGFDLPPEEIQAVVSDMFNGVKVFADYVIQNYSK